LSKKTDYKLDTYKVELIPVELLLIDKENPNEMRESELEGLRHSFKTYGNVEEIYVAPKDNKGKYKIADGEHRLKVLQEFGQTKIPCKVIPILKTEEYRRLFRQVKNKLRGTHEPQKDLNEIIYLMNAGKLKDLATLIAKPEDSLNFLIQQIQRGDKEVNAAVLQSASSSSGGNPNVIMEGGIQNQDIDDSNMDLKHTCPQCGYRFSD
jgi:ParB-like chromosome segregation protein Spo0J